MDQLRYSAGSGNGELVEQSGTVRCALSEESWGRWRAGAGVLVVHAQKGLREVSEEGLAGAGVGTQIRQKPGWGSPCARACCVLGQK